MSDKILTLIVPSYNMERYLPKCLGSLEIDSRLMERFEVLVINDGSKDATSRIAHDFAAKWPQTYKVIDKQNGHYGSCINAGLLVASGIYVKILDADDSFDTSAFNAYMEFLVNRIENEWQCTPDMIWNDFVWEDEDGVGFRTTTRSLRPDCVFDVEDAAVDLSHPYMHGVAYKTEKLRRINYQQTEGICYTDNEWCHLPVSAMDTVVYCKAPLYRYLYGRSGQSMEAALRAKNLSMLEKVLLRMMKNLQLAAGVSQKKKSFLSDMLLSVAENVYTISLVDVHTCESDHRLKEVDSALRTEAPNVYTELARRIYSKHLHFGVLNHWRRTGSSRTMPMRLYRVYRKLALFVRLGR